jgi:hypothetical protein
VDHALKKQCRTTTAREHEWEHFYRLMAACPCAICRALVARRSRPSRPAARTSRLGHRARGWRIAAPRLHFQAPERGR